ncbi:MAG TPA: ATP-grasp domain-containing protein [Kofleriaceae bacterium]|nr:ATP-grasp domain-containing protein [Kofleriaceae bacterium]
MENAARDVATALAERGHEVVTWPVPAGEPSQALAATVQAARGADLVFNLCESLAGDARHEGVLPALLDLAGVAYTGSGPVALGLALRKDVCKRLLRAHGVSTPEAVTLDSDDVSSVTLPFPLIVKPSREDASVGISRHSVVHDRRALALRVAEVRARYRQPAIVERFIEGRELYVTLLGNPPTAMPMHEIDFSRMPKGFPRIVSHDGKWDTTCDEYHGTRPVRAEGLDEATRARCHAEARAAFAALELRDYARVDLRLDAAGVPFVIDVNPNCDLSNGAGVSRAASYGGLSYPDLIEEVCEAALARTRENHVHPNASAPEKEAVVSTAAGPGAAPPGERPRALVAAGARGRPVHGGRGGGRAGAPRRRDR